MAKATKGKEIESGSKISPQLTKMITDLMTEVMKPQGNYSLTDKVKVADRGLKLEAIKAKLDDSGYGTQFTDDDDDNPDEHDGGRNPL